MLLENTKMNSEWGMMLRPQHGCHACCVGPACGLMLGSAHGQCVRQLHDIHHAVGIAAACLVLLKQSGLASACQHRPVAGGCQMHSFPWMSYTLSMKLGHCTVCLAWCASCAGAFPEAANGAMRPASMQMCTDAAQAPTLCCTCC
jgi:hypothetical protein